MSTNGEAEDVLRDLRVLDEIDRDPQVSQRTIAKRVGIALGLTNTILRRLVRKGMVSTRTLPANRLAYHLTPKGLAGKAKLVLDYTRTTASFFYNLRLVINRKLAELAADRHIHSVAIIGTGELADAVYLSVKEMGLELAGVWDIDGEGRRWLDLEVRRLPEGPIEADVLFVTRLDGVDAHEPRLARPGAIVIRMGDLLVTEVVYYARNIEQETT